jgi:hypothetical protein
MASTTSISDLPTGPPGSNTTATGNITLETIDKLPPAAVPPVAQAPIQAPTPETMPDSRKQLEMNQVISGIQQASAVGSTLLPSRDIPQDTLPLVQDSQSSPTFVPEHSGPRDYIGEADPQRLLEAEQRANTRRDATDDLYNEMQTPLLLAILYLLFQLPVTNKYLRKYLPPLFSSDGNQSPVGHVVISVMFASAFYGISLFVNKFSAAV